MEPKKTLETWLSYLATSFNEIRFEPFKENLVLEIKEIGIEKVLESLDPKYVTNNDEKAISIIILGIIGEVPPVSDRAFLLNYLDNWSKVSSERRNDRMNILYCFDFVASRIGKPPRKEDNE